MDFWDFEVLRVCWWWGLFDWTGIKWITCVFDSCWRLCSEDILIKLLGIVFCPPLKSFSSKLFGMLSLAVVVQFILYEFWKELLFKFLIIWLFLGNIFVSEFWLLQ